MTSIALITGGSGGIGQACAKALAPTHDIAVQYYQNRASATATVDVLTEEYDCNAAAFQCDVSDSNAVQRLVEAIGETLGDVDVLVNNAGVFRQQRLEEISEAELQQTLTTNLRGTVYCSRAVLPGMCRRDQGHIVSVSSTAGIHGSSTDPVYSASKGGQISFTKSLARMYTEQGVYANVVAPGPTETKLFPDDRQQAVERVSPIDRLIEPTEVAEAVQFFATATGITGQVLEIHGGLYE